MFPGQIAVLTLWGKLVSVLNLLFSAFF
jgi:hypothetical protein